MSGSFEANPLTRSLVDALITHDDMIYHGEKSLAYDYFDDIRNACMEGEEGVPEDVFVKLIDEANTELKKFREGLEAYGKN